MCMYWFTATQIFSLNDLSWVLRLWKTKCLIIYLYNEQYPLHRTEMLALKKDKYKTSYIKCIVKDH